MPTSNMLFIPVVFISGGTHLHIFTGQQVINRLPLGTLLAPLDDPEHEPLQFPVLRALLLVPDLELITRQVLDPTWPLSRTSNKSITRQRYMSGAGMRLGLSTILATARGTHAPAAKADRPPRLRPGSSWLSYSRLSLERKDPVDVTSLQLSQQKPLHASGPSGTPEGSTSIVLEHLLTRQKTSVRGAGAACKKI